MKLYSYTYFNFSENNHRLILTKITIYTVYTTVSAKKCFIEVFKLI